MGLFGNLFGGNDECDIVGEGDNLQEALDDYAAKVRALDPNHKRELTSIEVGNTDENGVDHPWFTLKLR